MSAVKPVITVTTNRYYNLVILPFVLGIWYAFFWAITSSDEPFFDEETTDMLVLLGVSSVSLIIVIMAIKTFLQNKPLFSVYDDGFIANTNGVESQKILWNQIKRIEERVATNANDEDGAVLAIFFNDPNYFAYSNSGIVGKLVRIGTIGKQISEGNIDETEAPMLIPIGSLGDDYPVIKSYIEDKIAEQQKKVPTS